MQAQNPDPKNASPHLHMLPPYRCPRPHNDGGHAVGGYRETSLVLGRMADFSTMHTRGIRLVLHLVGHLSGYDRRSFTASRKRRAKDPRL